MDFSIRTKQTHSRATRIKTGGLATCLLALSAPHVHAEPLVFAGVPADWSNDPVVSRALDNPTGDFYGVLAPLDDHPFRYVALDTANHMRRGGLAFAVGWHQANNDLTGGTGAQVHNVQGDWAVTDRLQLGVSHQNYDDPFHKPINGATPQLTFVTFGASAKYRVWENDRMAVSILGGVEYLKYDTPLIGTNAANAEHMIYTLQAPISYRISRELQLHVTPGVSVFPDSINGFDFHGTIPSLALGATWKPSERFLGYGSVNLPFGPGGNSISNTQTIVNTPVWTVGGRYNITPKVAFDLYATNGLGTSPATGILSFPPDGETVLAGVKLTYTPGKGPGYRSSYRANRAAPITDRNRALQHDGFTLGSAATLTPGTFGGRAEYGADGAYALAGMFSPDQDFQIEGTIDKFSVDGSVGAAQVSNINEARYMVGVKLRWLDQNEGDRISLATRAMFGRDMASAGAVGTLYLSMPVSYDFSDRTTLTVNPRVAVFGNTETYGLGVGINHEILPGLQAIAEATAVGDGETPVWAVGGRYEIPNSGFGVDLHATNAIGNTGLGTLVAQDETRLVLGVSVQLGKAGWR